MSSIVLPNGLIPVNTVGDPLQRNRTTGFTYTLLDQNENNLGVLEGVKPGGTLKFRRASRIKGGGKITVYDRGQDIDWLNSRIKIETEVNGVSWDLGVWMPTAPAEVWDDGQRSWAVELHDKTSIPDGDATLDTLEVAAGADPLVTVKNQLNGLGEFNLSITDTGETLTNAMTWEAGTSRLTIINALLDACGYFPLRMSMSGSFLIQPYVQPHQRGYRQRFVGAENVPYTPQYTRTQDNFSVPNRVVAKSMGDSDSEGLVGIATNEDPNSPYSYQARGRWITKVYENIETTSQTALDRYAYWKLLDADNPETTLKIEFAPVPLDIYDAVYFRSYVSGIDHVHTVESIDVKLDFESTAKATLKEVISA